MTKQNGTVCTLAVVQKFVLEIKGAVHLIIIKCLSKRQERPVEQISGDDLVGAFINEAVFNDLRHSNYLATVMK